MQKIAAAFALTFALAATLFALPPTARAASVSGQFDVTINLLSACEISTLPTAHFEYASGQTVPATFSSSFNIRCTKGLAIASIALDKTTVQDAATQLDYTLALSAVPTVGTGVAQTVNLTGSMAAGQGGNCTVALCTNASSNNKQRTLTITY